MIHARTDNARTFVNFVSPLIFCLNVMRVSRVPDNKVNFVGVVFIIESISLSVWLGLRPISFG